MRKGTRKNLRKSQHRALRKSQRKALRKSQRRALRKTSKKHRKSRRGGGVSPIDALIKGNLGQRSSSPRIHRRRSSSSLERMDVDPRGWNKSVEEQLADCKHRLNRCSSQ